MKSPALTLAAAAILATGTAYAVQLSPDRMLELSTNIARMVGMSPAGTATWARLSVARGEAKDYRELERLDRAIGEQLARDTPDRARLADLAQQYAAEKARFALEDQQRTIADALTLADADRKILGRFIIRSRVDSGSKAPVVAPMP